MIPEEMRARILNALYNIEKEENVKIFYACESGSRAWGFPSADSDYDVRFLYIHPINWYLSIDKGRDVIEREIEGNLDLSGWDLQKALKLFRSSNPPLLEWLRSPIIYLEKDSVARNLRDLMPEYYSPVACLHHYLHMAQGNFRDYLKGGNVWTKKYFYILRPILACRWIESDAGPVPMEFDILVDRLVESGELESAINDLLELKKDGNELSWGPRIPVISDFIEFEIERLERKQFEKRKPKPGSEKLNQLFISALEEIQ